MNYTNMDIDHEGTRSDNHPDSYGDSSAFPWMGHYSPVPIERFPTSTSHHPIVHEGFVPDDEEMMDEPYGIGSKHGAGVHTGEASRFVAYENVDYNDHFNSSDYDDKDSVSSDKEGNRSVARRSFVLEVLLIVT